VIERVIPPTERELPKIRRLLSIGHSYVVAVNRRLAHAMQEAGRGKWEVCVVAPTYFHGRHDLRPAALQIAEVEPVPVVPVRAYNTRMVHGFFYGRRLRSILRENWDLIHAWEEPFVAAGFQISRYAPAKSRFVFRTAQSLPKQYPPPFAWFERSALRRADGWICSGKTVEENLLQRPGYSSKPHALITLGVDLERFRPNVEAGAAVRRQLGWTPGGPPVVGYLGRFVAEKGLYLLMRALDRLGRDWRALFAGGGPLEAQLRAWAARHEDRVRIITNLPHEQVPEYLNAMDVLAAPSQTTRHWREQFGRMLIEAFAVGVPVIGSDSGEIPYVLADDGVVVPEADETAWMNALGDLLAKPHQRADLAARGLQRAIDYAWPTIGRKHLEFFNQLLDSPSSHW